MVVSDSKLVLLLIASLLVCSLEALDQSCDPNDLAALREIAGSLTNGTILSGWSNASFCCQWDGVVCGGGGELPNASVRVTGLILSGRGLKGNISRALAGLDQLKVLDLSSNSLDGGIPVELSNLHHLELLDLSSNALSGSILSMGLGGLNSIRSMNLSSNSFTGELPDLGAAFPNLAVFNISNNLFSGRIDTKICNTSSTLRVLDLCENRFSGGLMEGNCSLALQQLHVDSNSLSGHLPDTLFRMSSLEHLSVSCNRFSGPLSHNLSKLSRLKTLVISGNEFSGSLPNVFENLTKLEQLIAHSNHFSGSLPPSLSLCSMLQVLDLRNNSLNGFVDLNFSTMPHLNSLDLATNLFTGHLPPTLASCNKLKTLSLAKNNFYGEIPTGFAKLTALSFLSLSNNSFNSLPRALGVLQQCRNLTTLILTKNFRGEDIPENVSGFDNLMILALGNCGLNGQIPMWLLNCTKLQVIDLSWNHLSGSIPPWIGKMESLFYLDISNNSLTGEIPKTLTDLKSLISSNASPNAKTISVGIPLYVKRNQSAHGLQYNQVSSFPPSLLLSNNKISGTLWPDIGRLKGLHVLDLSRNNISGNIPSTISDMENLEILDLSFNDLYGSIPSSFDKLTFLSRFSVANNHLRGVIPIGGQFSSFPNSSFEGNVGLCGVQVHPCKADHGLVQSEIRSGHGSSKVSRGTILGITISVGVGITLLLAVVLLNLSRKDARVVIDDVEENFCRRSETLGSSKLVILFETSDSKELTIGDLLKSTNNFDQANIIGCGGFGLVYKANLPNGTKAAIKRLSGDCGQMEREFRAEVEALSRAQHKNLVPLQGYCRHGDDRLLIYLYMENGSLDYWLHERVDGGTVLKWDARLKIAQGAGKGLAYLHKGCEPNIVHRDIKSSNILLDENFEAHLADFGLARLLCPYDTHVTTDLVGTLGYIPPEYSQTLTATFKGDVYSFGVVLLELLTSRRPVDVCKAKGSRDLVSWVLQLKLENKVEQIIDPSIWSKDLRKQFVEVLGIACKCIDQDPRRRPSIEQVVLSLDSVSVADA